MDVSKFQLEGEWLKLEVESKNIEGMLEFKIKPMSSSEQLDLAEIGKNNIKEFLSKIDDLILDWNLEEGDNKLFCDKGNKTKYLPYLIGIKVKSNSIENIEEVQFKGDEEGEKIEINTVGMAIITFAQDFTNFIKN